jgi:hypothetical protein
MGARFAPAGAGGATGLGTAGLSAGSGGAMGFFLAPGGDGAGPGPPCGAFDPGGPAAPAVAEVDPSGCTAKVASHLGQRIFDPPGGKRRSSSS